MIRFEQVSKVFPDGTVAVNRLDLEVSKGELVVLIGPSGCGKTTTLKMVNRIIEPSAGHIMIDGIDTA
ncbi:MAG TPA: ATP-binding cassette domain-containing protein, partial [Symbiobacteriaceae bacterium]|nr:ATP-binding cassette domain-containing protein [Symbiobacteriaceae bacterium]